MTINLLTFLAAFGTLLWVYIPQPFTAELVQQDNLWKELLFGFRYIFERPGLRALVVLFLGGNFFEGLCTTLIARHSLACLATIRSWLGSVELIGALGGIIGGVLISVWGGPQASDSWNSDWMDLRLRLGPDDDGGGKSLDHLGDCL